MQIRIKNTFFWLYPGDIICVSIYTYFYTHTHTHIYIGKHSTAQGGGGTFKSQQQLQLQLQLLRYTTLHPGVVSEVTAATIATTPKSTTPTTFRSISGFVLPSVSHNDQPFL